MCLTQLCGSGGLELLVAGAKRVDVALPARAHCMRDLIRHVRETVVQERPELFSVDDTVLVCAGACVQHWR